MITDDMRGSSCLGGDGETAGFRTGRWKKRSPEPSIAALPEFGSLDRRRIAALVGLAPWTRRSGQWRGKSFTRGGRKERAQFLVHWSHGRGAL